MKYSGCSLDVVSKEEIESLRVSNKQVLSRRVENISIGGNFTRRVGISVPYSPDSLVGYGLDRYLSKVDSYFTQLASSIGGLVVKHEWALLPRKETEYVPATLERLGVIGYDLVARVECVRGSKISFDTVGKQKQNDLLVALKTNSEEFFNEHGWYVADAATPSQFISEHACASDPILVDIEPRVVNYNVRTVLRTFYEQF